MDRATLEIMVRQAGLDKALADFPEDVAANDIFFDQIILTIVFECSFCCLRLSQLLQSFAFGDFVIMFVIGICRTFLDQPFDAKTDPFAEIFPRIVFLGQSLC